MRSAIRGLLGSTVALICALTASAQPVAYALYGIDGGSVYRLLSINAMTGAATAIGPTGRPVTGLTFCPDGRAYGLDGNNNLLSIDPATGATTLIGPTVQQTAALACSPDGRLYGLDGGQATLYLFINRATGLASGIGVPTALRKVAIRIRQTRMERAPHPL